MKKAALAAATLAATLAAVLASTFLTLLAQSPAPRVVPVTAKRFEFVPKEVHVKRGEPVTLRLKSEDVTHGFFSRPLKLDLDIPPDKATDVTITPAAAGTFPVICDRFCGAGHAGMKMTIVVE